MSDPPTLTGDPGPSPNDASASTTTLESLAQAAGIATTWLDVHNRWHTVSDDTLCLVLAAMGLPATTTEDRANSHRQLADQATHLAPLLTASVGEPTTLGVTGAYTLTLEDGSNLTGNAVDGVLPPIDQPGYHHLDLAGQRTIIAVAPRQGHTVDEATHGKRPWVLAVQLYALRRAGDGGLGDFAALQDLLAPAAEAGAAGIAISPVHAQFSADPDRFSPYSPSSRVQLNVLHAPLDLPAEHAAEAAALEAAPLVDWPAAARIRLAALRTAYHDASPATLDALAAFRAREGDALQNHAVFEALHAREFAAGRWHWRSWAPELQDPDSEAVRAFAAEHADEVGLHAFMQFRASSSLSDTQAAARAAGMPIGLVADLAVGADSGGSHCWSRQAEILNGISVGAPPDLLSAQGQNWGLAAFSPVGLRANGYRAFLEMLRHAMRNAGGVRIDHALGLARLWVVPDGLSAAEGVYIAFPTTDLLRLIALESHRNRAITLGEDLGTIPGGFQDRMAAEGMLGMRVLWFEKLDGLFLDPSTWSKAAAAMTSTHDLATVAGWWNGHDLEWRGRLGVSGGALRHEAEKAERQSDRAALWAAFTHSGAATGPMPTGPDAPGQVVDAAIRHLATSACDLIILPIEDALALTEQPNLPGTMNEHPNWRRRLDGPAANLLDPPRVRARLAPMTKASFTT